MWPSKAALSSVQARFPEIFLSIDNADLWAFGGIYLQPAGGFFPADPAGALIAVAVVVVARMSYRKIPPLTCMAWALFLIALTQPLAASSAGFWLSFTAVGVVDLVVLSPAFSGSPL